MNRPRRERREEAPLESAGQLAWLLGTLLLVTLPHVPHVHPWVTAMVIGIAAARLSLALRRRRLPSAWLRVPLTLLAFAGILATYRQVSGVDAGSSLLLVMAAMKLLETRGRRDRAIVVFICFFLLFAAFLREQAVWSPAYLLLTVTVATMALLQTARPRAPLPPAEALAVTGRLLLQAAPLALLLFLLFPRIPGPFWSLPQAGGRAHSGLSDELSPGDISELVLSDEVAFRVRFDGPPPASAQLYWRGPVLAKFDGRRWSARAPAYLPGLRRRLERSGPEVGYEITLEPHRQPWLLALETPIDWDAPKAALSSTFTLASIRPVERRLAYRARSLLSTRTPGSMPAPARAADTWLPPDSNPRSRAWAAELRAASRDERDYLGRILAHFRREPFFYSLTPAALGAQSVDEFLFDRREGFCGHYASAFAVLARAAGIPARIVTGYQGGERNPLGDYWIVRQADAHAWVEVWLDGHWERIDPTAAVAPERIERGMDTAVRSGRLRGAEALRGSALGQRLLLSWDAVNAAWNRWVLAYGPDSQQRLLRLAGIADPSLRHLLALLIAGMSAGLAWLAWRSQRRHSGRPDPLLRSYRLLCRRTARAWRARRPAETPAEYAAAAARARPELAAQIRGLFEDYERLRYEPDADRAAIGRFEAEVRRFRPPRAPARARA
ncbi:MAG: DUF3488 domain-containing protein [Gammaproteobacteria bacterium]|nr:MAG: DUF3488 domain-containing protein [Gammaproteobacteria bacterium]